MPEWLERSIFIITQAVVLLGLFGLIVPIFPGLLVIWLGVLGYAIVVGFQPVGIGLFILITLFMLFGMIVDNLLMGAGARKGGASWLSILVALIAGVVGTLVFPPFGGIVAAPLAVFLLEFIRRRDVLKGWEALRGLAAGWGLSFVAQFIIGLAMMGLWWIWAWLD